MERIHVSVRAKPLSQDEAKTSPWRISGNSISIPNLSKFEFDQIFSENCATAQVFEARTKDIVEAAVRGFNGTVFAYGQTNSGKTYTMRGTKAEPGVIPLAVHDLFQIIQQDVDREFLLRMSYMEIYNEEINDLLAPEHRKLQIHENLERGIYVAGLREEIVASPEQILDLMEFGESHRHIGETNMNVYSSRSHTIFRMIIESRDRSEDGGSGSSCDAVRVSVLNLVDLAGSERAAKTGAEGVRLKEGSHINKSLMTLGTVIKKLSEGAESQGSHVPYRDSKLTRILQPSLGGNARTAIICNITLAQIHTDETKSSLQFASRALRVTNCAQVNEILTDAALLKRQKKEIEDLRAKLMGSHSEHLEQEILNLRNTLLQTELERERIALELEEEKKAQVEWEKRVQEQAKKIENLSSMVLFSNRDESREHIKKDKRRDTWCIGNLSGEHLRNSSIYSTKSAYEVLWEGVAEENLEDCFRVLWKIRIPSKIAVFAWRLLRDRLPTKSNLQARQVQIPDLNCPFCGRMEEDASHLFIHCSKIQPLWWDSMSWINLKGAMPLSTKQLFMQYSFLQEDGRRNRRWQYWWLAITWSTWQLRNRILFSGATFDGNKLVEDAIFLMNIIISYTLFSGISHGFKSGNFLFAYGKVYPGIQPSASTIKPIRPKRDMGPLLPFEELVNEDVSVDEPFKQEEDNKDDTNKDCNLPNPCALLHVTNRKKAPSLKKSLSMEEDNKFLELQAEYESLFLKFETQRTISEIQIESLRKQLIEETSLQCLHSKESIDSLNYAHSGSLNADKNVNFRESDAILVIKRLQDQIKVLEMENLSSQKSLDNVVGLATKQNICAREKYEELYEELISAQETARLANEQLTSTETASNINDGNFDFVISVSMGIEEIVSEIQNSKDAVQSVMFMVDDAITNFSALYDMLLVLKTSVSQDSAEQSLVLSNYQKLNSCLRKKIFELENEKILLDNQLADLQKHLQESKLDSQNSQNSLMENLEQHKFENAELISYIQTLEKDLSCLTSSSVTKDRETLRKDLEKTKSKLKETESKLKITIQEKTKLEGEKAYAEREIKRLHGQNSLLERDINKRDSLAGRRRDSIVERGSKMFDPKRPKGLAISLEQTLQEEHKKLEVFAFESEAKIASLEEKIAAMLMEKEEVISVNEGLMSELEGLTEKLNTSTSELYNLMEEISALKQRLEESDINQEKLKSSVKVLMEEKEELAMQLTDSLLEIEEERAIWSAKEKDALLAIEEQAKSNNVQITSLSTKLLECCFMFLNGSKIGNFYSLIFRIHFFFDTQATPSIHTFSSALFYRPLLTDLFWTTPDASIHIRHLLAPSWCFYPCFVLWHYLEYSGVRNELESCREECKTLRERLTITYENAHIKENSREKVSELDHLENHPETTNAESKQSQEMSKANSEMQSLEHELHDSPKEEKENELRKEIHVLDKGDNLSSPNVFQNLKDKQSVVTKERDKLMIEMEDQHKRMEFLQKNCQDELSKAKVHIEELNWKLSDMEAKMPVGGLKNNKEMAKLRMRLRGTQAKLDSFRCRYKEAIDESVLTNKKYKDQLASKGLEVLNLMKQLAAAKGQ
ncbi:Kinesin-like protein KIN-7O [Glycine soja]